jgi:hypothetical protein
MLLIIALGVSWTFLIDDRISALLPKSSSDIVLQTTRPTSPVPRSQNVSFIWKNVSAFVRR